VEDEFVEADTASFYALAITPLVDDSPLGAEETLIIPAEQVL
jgi:hypothetical protein